MKRIGCHLTSQQIEILKAESIKSGISVAELIRRAIDFYCVCKWNHIFSYKEVVKDDIN